MPNLQQEEIVAVLVIFNFLGNSSIRKLQKHYVNGSVVAAVHLRLFKCIYMMPTFLYFFNLGSIHHRTDLTVSEDAGIEFNRNLGLLHTYR
jgi:hypothetical protein